MLTMQLTISRITVLCKSYCFSARVLAYPLDFFFEIESSPSQIFNEIFTFERLFELCFGSLCFTMPGRIDSDLLQAIYLEFEAGCSAKAVWGHCADIGTPVSMTYVRTFYNRWRESGSLSPGPGSVMGRPHVLNMHMVDVSNPQPKETC